MNFLCDQCKQKYHVADEKIRGRAVTRFKCKKCEHVIELRMPEGDGADGSASAEGSVASALPDKDLSGVTASPSVLPPAPRTGMTGAHSAAKPGAPLPTRQPTGTGLPVAPPRPASATGALPTRQPTGTGLPVAAPRPAPTGSVPAAGSSPLPTRQPTGTGLPVAAPRPGSAAGAPGASSTAARAAATAAAPVAAPRPAPAASPLRKNLAGSVEGAPKTSTAASALLNASETGWYAGVRDVPVGPLNRNELAAKIEAGDIHADTLVWREGLDDWRPLRSVQELSELVRNAAQRMSDGLLGTMGRPAPASPMGTSGGKVVPISQARAPGKPAAETGGFGEGEDDSPTQMHTVSDLVSSKDPKAARAAARVADALIASPPAAPPSTPARASVAPPPPAPAVARSSVAPPPPAPATASSKPVAEAGPDKSGWSWGAPGAAEKPAEPVAEKPAAAPAPRPFATLNNAPVAKLPPGADPLAMPAAPPASNSNPLGLPSLAAPMPPPTAAGAAAVGESTRVALGLPAPQKKGGIPVGVWILMVGFGATCLAVGLLLGTRQTAVPPAAPAPAATVAAASPTDGPTQRRVGADIQVPTGDLPAAAAPEANNAAAAPMPGETPAQAAARRSHDPNNSNSRGSTSTTTVASAAGSAHAPPTPSAPLMPEPGPMPLAPTATALRSTTAAPPPTGPTGAERAQQVLGVVNRAGAVGGCWNQATRRNPAHRNENIQVAIDVSPNGRAGRVTVSGAGDADLALCIQTRVRSTIFPPGEAVSTRASYSLSPGH